MWIASVPPAAAPLGGVAPAAAAPDAAVPFDEALAASLLPEQQAPADDAPAPGVGQFTLVEWLLSGVSVDTSGVPQSPKATSSMVVEEELEAAEGDDEETEEIPAEVLLIALPWQQQPAIEVVPAPTDKIPALVPVVVEQSNAGGSSRQDAAPMLDAAATTRTSTVDVVPPAPAAPKGEVRAAEPHDTRTIASEMPEGVRAEAPSAVVPGAVAAVPATKSTVVDARPPAGAETPTRPVEVASDRGAALSTPAPAVTDVHVATAPALPVETVAEPSETPSAASARPATSAAEAAPLAAVGPEVEGIERETRDGAAAMPRAVTSTPAAKVETPMGGGDARNFEGDSRRSPAAQRLAAALSKAGQAISRDAGGSPAPAAFSVPVQPGAGVAPVQAAAATTPTAPQPTAVAVPVQPVAVAAPVAPVVVTAPVTAPTHVDSENVHTLVEAMRITAKAGGWEATVRLKPEHLGEVTIALKVDGKNVSAIVQAESAGVRQWLMSQEDAVRSGMSEHGLQLDRFAVSRDGQRREAGHQQPQQQRRRAPRQAEAGSAPRFEVVV